MAGVTEKEVQAALLKYSGTGKLFKVGKAELEVTLEPKDIHVGDSPDFILWLHVKLRIFAQNLSIKIPLPIEAEKAGIEAAIEDLQKFSERGHYPAEIPMLVIAGEGYYSLEEVRDLKVKFKVRQIPVKLLQNARRNAV